MTDETVKRGESWMALFALLSMSTYLRPSSVLALGPGSFLALKGPWGCWSPFVQPAERGAPDNIGECDHSMLVDSAWLQLILPLLSSLTSQTGRGAVWVFACWGHLKVFAECAKMEVPQRSETARGVECRADSSAVRCEKHARLRHGELRCPEGLALRLRTCERQLEGIILHGKAVIRCSWIWRGGDGASMSSVGREELPDRSEQRAFLAWIWRSRRVSTFSVDCLC
ncbi:unnamed protein product [Prorocentrum cordatum]|uniref:Secreted protein n=1 Tax=Prorocentrum cordatum TaxID=2364126 RepID=A0ABN9RIP4_9DINO|nr:unnamed protein product [Polarella glacialis]